MADRGGQDRDTDAADPVVAAGEPGEYLIGALLCGRWEVQSLLGEGSMGMVFRARDRELDETVALKVLRQPGAPAEAVERFRREVRLARRVSHRNVARVYDCNEEDGVRFFTMELVAGESLRAILEREGPLPQTRLLSTGVALARGLGAAHEVGVVHRDLKPDNVMVAGDGRIAITDFGIAASFERTGVADTASFVGTPLYMAPEQVDRSHAVTAKTDLYALGAVLFELATGRPPFQEETALATAAARLTKPAPDPRAFHPALPEPLARLITSCLALHPADRPADAREVEAVLSSLDDRAPAVSVAPPASGPLAHATTFSPWSARSAPRVRLAVLPLLNQGAADDAFVADGLTDDLVDALSTVTSLRVLSRSVTEKLSGRRDVDPRSLGKELSIDVVVTGSARRLGDGGVALALRLASCEHGGQLWSHKVQVGPEKLLQVNEEAARAITAALSLDAGRNEQRLTNPAAVELYLKARAHYREISWRGGELAAQLFEQALKLAPDDHVLLSGRALALARTSFFRADQVGPALRAAEQAVARAPHSGEAHLAMATAQLQRAELKEAFREAMLALQLCPSLGEAHQLAGRILAETGPLDAAERALALAVEIEPRIGLTQVNQVHVLVYAGKHQEARALHDTVGLGNEKSEAFLVSRARLALWTGDEAEARAAAAALRAVEPQAGERSNVALILGLLSDLDQALSMADQAIAKAKRLSPRFGLFLLQVVCEFAGDSGKTELGIRLLREAVTAGLTDLMWLDHCPPLASLREHAEWRELRAPVLQRAAEIHALLPGGRDGR